MDPVHDRGSMDPVHESGPWTPSKVGVHGPLVHVLSSPSFGFGVKMMPIENIQEFRSVGAWNGSFCAQFACRLTSRPFQILLRKR